MRTFIFDRVQIGLETFKIKQAFMTELKMNISRRMVNNIRYEYSFDNPFRSDTSDIIYVQIFLYEFNSNNNIYWKIGPIEDLVLILQSKTQKEISSQFATIGID